MASNMPTNGHINGLRLTKCLLVLHFAAKKISTSGSLTAFLLVDATTIYFFQSKNMRKPSNYYFFD